MQSIKLGIIGASRRVVTRGVSLSILSVLLFFGVFVVSSTPALAEQQAACGVGQTNYVKDKRVCCPQGAADTAQKCFFAKYLNPAIVVLSALAGVAMVIGILLGAIEYSSSGGDPQKVAKGKSKIINSLTALVVFMLLYSGIQFLSPGGINNSTPTGSGNTLAERCTANTFLGLKPWFYYMPDSAFRAGTCYIDDFDIFSLSDGVLPIALVIADDLVRIAGIIAVAYVIIGGIQYVVSQAEPDRTKRARDSIINALIGLVVAIIAASVISFVGQRLTS